MRSKRKASDFPSQTWCRIETFETVRGKGRCEIYMRKIIFVRALQGLRDYGRDRARPPDKSESAGSTEMSCGGGRECGEGKNVERGKYWEGEDVTGRDALRRVRVLQRPFVAFVGRTLQSSAYHGERMDAESETDGTECETGGRKWTGRDERKRRSGRVGRRRTGRGGRRRRMGGNVEKRRAAENGNETRMRHLQNLGRDKRGPPVSSQK